MIKVKICGITNVQDAWMAVALGADALGFIFAPSPRQVTPERAREIIDSIPPLLLTVGVFVNEALTTIRDIMNYCGLHMVQLHGDESPDYCRSMMPYAIKAFRLKDESSLLPMPFYQKHIRGLLLDTYHQGLKGGTGRTFDWNLAIKAKALGIPIILSGGLGVSNIQRAISSVRPYAVDLNSGIEERPGKKDPALTKQIMERIKRMNRKGLSDDK